SIFPRKRSSRRLKWTADDALGGFDCPLRHFRQVTASARPLPDLVNHTNLLDDVCGNLARTIGFAVMV
ncbi:MAG: hypothetical protein AAF742_05575, partial [Pseudomonadota bacterium]